MFQLFQTRREHSQIQSHITGARDAVKGLHRHINAIREPYNNKHALVNIQIKKALDHLKNANYKMERTTYPGHLYLTKNQPEGRIGRTKDSINMYKKKFNTKVSMLKNKIRLEGIEKDLGLKRNANANTTIRKRSDKLLNNHLADKTSRQRAHK